MTQQSTSQTASMEEYSTRKEYARHTGTQREKQLAVLEMTKLISSQSYLITSKTKKRAYDSLEYRKNGAETRTRADCKTIVVEKHKGSHRTWFGDINRRTWRFQDHDQLVVVQYLEGTDKEQRPRQRKTMNSHASTRPGADSICRVSTSQMSLQQKPVVPFAQARQL